MSGSTVAVIGAGAVGRAIMEMLAGFNCRRVYVDKTPLTADAEARLGCERIDLDGALKTSDFVVLAVHLMPDTLQMVDPGFIARMKPGSYLINPARGSLVDEDAVLRALERGNLGGYAADTFEMEDWARPDRPKDVSSGLLSSDRTVFTPHIGSAVTSVRQAIEASAADSIISIAGGHIPDGVVNRDAFLVSQRT